jgi:arylsulfatase A-like enzyme
MHQLPATSNVIKALVTAVLFCLQGTLIGPLSLMAATDERPYQATPNVLWILIEDMSPHLSCYGEQTIQTPNMDYLASVGVLFENAYATASVCSAARSAMITGMYQTSIGAHHHRSGRGEIKIHLPEYVELVPALMQRAGYWTGNGPWPAQAEARISKTDFNFEWDPAVYNCSDWSGRAEGQPFFHQIHLNGGKMRDIPRNLEAVYDHLETPVTADDVTLPPYYADHPKILQDWAHYLNSILYTDWQVGEIIKRLKDEGDYENTVILLMSDHGVSHVRAKQLLYEEGVKIPFIVSGPGIPQDQRRDDLALLMDAAAVTLALGGVAVPDHMHAVDLLCKDYEPREWIALARDRTGEAVDRSRAIRKGQYKYIRNFFPRRPYLVPSVYNDDKPTTRAMREWLAAGKLNPVQLLVMADEKPVEELYHLCNDPYEINNLAENPAFASKLAELRNTLDYWMETTNDHGEECPKMYKSEMEETINRLSRNHPAMAEQVRQNVETIRAWAEEGR